MNTIYTTGYAGRQPAALLSIAVDLGACIIDIRYRAVSRMPQWNRPALKNTLGECYCQLPALGNVNYGTGGPITLDNPEVGIPYLLELAGRSPLILICGCRDYENCHRRTVADLLRAQGADCRELEWPVEDTPPGIIKCLSLWQPHASLFGRGKLYETRSWPTRYRGPLAIHAGKSKEDLWLCGNEPYLSALRGQGWQAVADLPCGAIVAIGNLTDCKETGHWVRQIPEPARSFGDFSPGRFAWKIDDVQILPEPLPYRGQQGLFDVELPELQVNHGAVEDEVESP